MNERRLRDALRRGTPPDPAARDRAWRMVRAAYHEHEPRPPRRPVRGLALATAVLAVVIVAVSTTAPGDAVARWVQRVLGEAVRSTSKLPLSVEGIRSVPRRLASADEHERTDQATKVVSKRDVGARRWPADRRRPPRGVGRVPRRRQAAAGALRRRGVVAQRSVRAGMAWRRAHRGGADRPGALVAATCRTRQGRRLVARRRLPHRLRRGLRSAYRQR